MTRIYLGVPIKEERYTVESGGYDRDDVRTSWHTRYLIGDKSFSFLSEAKLHVFNKTPKGKKFSEKIKKLVKEEKKLETASRRINKKIQKLHAKKMHVAKINEGF